VVIARCWFGLQIPPNWTRPAEKTVPAGGQQNHAKTATVWVDEEKQCAHNINCLRGDTVDRNRWKTYSQRSRFSAVLMSVSPESPTTANNENFAQQASRAGNLWARVVELWILAAILIFFVIRVAGSQIGSRVLARLTHGLLP